MHNKTHEVSGQPVIRGRRPSWLKIKLPGDRDFARVSSALREEGLHTVCEGARCPNRGDCWGRGTATFMILGDHCTRGCRFCGVPSGVPADYDLEEADRVARAVARLGLKHAVVTSVTRDDLNDGGSELFALVIRRIREASPGTTVEVLTPDFKGDEEAIGRVTAARPDVFAHNLETVPRLYPVVRPGADYKRSLRLLSHVRESAPFLPTKTGIMLGLGETVEEIEEVMRDVVGVGVRIMTLGQYLRPTREHLSVDRFVPPDEFEALAKRGKAWGLKWIEAGPLVRSSYRADSQLAASIMPADSQSGTSP